MILNTADRVGATKHARPGLYPAGAPRARGKRFRQDKNSVPLNLPGVLLLLLFAAHGAAFASAGSIEAEIFVLTEELRLEPRESRDLKFDLGPVASGQQVRLSLDGKIRWPGLGGHSVNMHVGINGEGLAGRHLINKPLSGISMSGSGFEWAKSEESSYRLFYSSNFSLEIERYIRDEYVFGLPEKEQDPFHFAWDITPHVRTGRNAVTLRAGPLGEGLSLRDVMIEVGEPVAYPRPDRKRRVEKVADGIDFGEGFEVLMNFDFSGLGGEFEYRDGTGKHTIYSDAGSFLEEHSSLRTAFGSRFRIPCENNAFGEEFTINVWLVKSSRGWVFRSPVLGRGFVQAYAGPLPGEDDFDFMLDVNGRAPGFQTSFGGLRTSGGPYSQNYRYSDSSYERIPPEELFELDRWQNLTVVYEKGRVSMYINGKLSGETDESTTRPLLTSGQPLYLGASRVAGEEDNKDSSQLLLRNLTVYRGALSAGEVQSNFKSQAQGFPLERRYHLGYTNHYYPSNMLAIDREMKNRLPLSEAYLEDKPEDPYRDKESMSGAIEGDGESIRLMINRTTYPPVAVNNHAYDRNEHRHNELILDFAAADVNLIGAGILTGDFWTGENEYDWEKLDSRINSFIDINPRAKIKIRVGASPPPWFVEKYPEEMEEYYIDRNDLSMGKRKWTTSGPLGSEKWLEISTGMIRDFVKHVEASSYNNRVYGYSISGGDAGEWYWPGQFSGGATGYSRPTLESFRKFVREKYGNDESMLREAWGDPVASFSKIQAPPPSERTESENFLFFSSPGKTSRALDFQRFINYRTLLNFNESARALRESASEGKIITTYYGYSLYYAGRGVLHMSGLQGTSEALRSPWIDGIATPLDYLRRRGGDPGVNIAGFTGAARLNNKIIWREEDIRTHFHPRLEFGRTSSLRESIEVIRRAFAYTVAGNYGMWFVCQAEMWAYHQQEMMEDIKKMMGIAGESASIRRADVAEAALIFDEKDSLTFTAPAHSSFIIDHIWGAYQNAHLMGAPFNLYFLDDLADPNMPDYKLYVFLNPYSINRRQMEMIARKVKKNGAVAVWSYAPGYLSDEGFSLENMRKLTGFSFNEEREWKTIGGGAFTESVITAEASPFMSYRVGPVFSVKNEDSVRVLAACGEGRNILAGKEFDSWRSVYSLMPLTRELLTGLCDYAGVHVYTRDGSLLLANDSYIAVHSGETGPKRVELPRPSRVEELIEGRYFGRVESFEDEFELPGTTRIYRLK